MPKGSIVNSPAVKLAEAKVKGFFACLQGIYDASRNISSSELQGRFIHSASNIEQLRTDYLQAVEHFNLVQMENDPTFEPDYQNFIAFENLYSSIKTTLNKLNAKSDTKMVEKSRISLPPINLVKFNGELNQWASFFECYNNVVHNNTNLTNSDRVFYLRGILSGSALTCIADIPPTGDNYELIYSTLVQKYQDVRTLGTEYLKQIVNMKPLTSSSAEGLNLFLDKFSASVNAFDRLNITDKTDFIYLYLALQKIDRETVQLFENSVRSEKLPTYNSLITFIKEQVKINERSGLSTTSSANKNYNNKISAPKPNNNTKFTKSFVTSNNNNTACPLCSKSGHEQYYRCPEFIKLNPKERFNVVKQHNSCVNCLSFNHKTAACKSNKTCNTCQRKGHHSLLHFENNTATHNSSIESRTFRTSTTTPRHLIGIPTDHSTNVLPSNSRSAVAQCVTDDRLEQRDGGSLEPALRTHAHTTRCDTPSSVLLATARVIIKNRDGTEFSVRALLDSGSMNDFVTKGLCDRLSIDINALPEQITVSGFGGTTNDVHGDTNIVIHSRFDRNIIFELHPLVVEKITDTLPSSPIDRSMLNYLARTPLADDTFSEPGEVEMLIGAKLFARLLLRGRVNGPPGTPTAIQTPLGFVLMGDAPVAFTHAPASRSLTHIVHTNTANTGTDTVSRPAHTRPARSQAHVFCALTAQPLDAIMRSFWETEEVSTPRSALLSQEEQACENIYRSTTTRDSSGSYVVALPFKTDPSVLGDSIKTSKNRLSALEKRFLKSPHLKSAYDNILLDYLDKEYITHLPASEAADESKSHGYVIPHHGVIRDDKLTTKVRLVLDASASTDTNVSLNDILHSGPNLQSDLFVTLLNFRLFPFALCADVEQMYLRIMVHPDFHKYQRILYRFDLSDPVQMFQFKRVCFGLTSSPYLALRTLHQLAEDEKNNFPLASEVIDQGFYYMDDICFSVKDLSSAKETAQQLIDMFSAGGFKLHKWSSNSSEVLSALPPDHLHPQHITFDATATQKVLGVNWDPQNDNFYFVTCSPGEVPCTKRNMLSLIARLWDVMGFAAPLILYAKLLIKELWLLKIDWDDHPPQNIITLWNKFQRELPLLSKITIPRHIGVTETCNASLIGFSDASEKGYGAVLYVRSQTDDDVSVHLLCAKSKVAPVQIVSLARLELMAAHLLTKLIRVVLNTYKNRFNFNNIYAFCDSTIALNWIYSSPHRLKTFVANRVAKIQEVISPHHFHHIPGNENPSDCLSRGMTPAQFIQHSVWMTAPSWLKYDISDWPIQPFIAKEENLPESKTITLSNTQTLPKKESPLLALTDRVSRWSKLLRVIVYVLRFSKRLKSRGDITAQDLNAAELTVIKAVQNHHFPDLFKAMQSDKPCLPSFRKLRPFIVDGIIRVGGRLANSDLTYDHKHPILMPNKDRVCQLLIDHLHRISCHAGPQLLLSLLRQRFWILSARRTVRARVHACVPCFKTRPKPAQSPVMSDLPVCRLKQSKPFTHCGVDYGGPLYITLCRKRGQRSQKAYLCVFICMTTRAVHVEVAPDLTTDSFLNAFKRFISRRGPVERLYSDHGTNFVGAKAYLHELQQFLNSDAFTSDFRAELANNRISWEMIPPNAPHFGGGWEAAIKSFKTHLFRVIGSQILTYEELLTVLCQVEAILNSRPLGILSEDPSEPLPLTPAHFLNMTPLAYFPSVNEPEINQNLLSRYMLLDRLVHSYWRRWRDEYLHTLQLRGKWNTDACPVKEGMLVLIRDDNSQPLHWPMGIIQQTYTGKDGLIRVVLVKTKTGTFKRPVVRLCPLPIFN